MKLPVIDFSVQPLKPTTPEWELVRAQVRQALEEFGFFEAVFPTFPVSLRGEFFESVKEFFDLPSETKKLNVSSKPFASYVNGRDLVVNLPFEAATIENANISKKVESFASVSWPHGNPSFCKIVQSYTNQASELDKIIRRMIFESLGIEKHLEDHLRSTKNYSIRFTKYEDHENNESKKLALTAHKDVGLLNILSQSQVDGLEVQTKDGQWIPVKPSPCSFMVILGDAFASVLANGRLYSPVHRVMISGNTPRYTAGLFCCAEEDYLIETLKELVDEEHPLVFKPFYMMDFFKFVETDGQKYKSALKAYSGV